MGAGAPHCVASEHAETIAPGKEVSVKRLTLNICVALALMLGTASSASAAPSNPPNCFGQGAKSIATSGPGATADFVKQGHADSDPPDVTLGDLVGVLKATCVPPA
jgi:hypothetical protein